MVALLGFIIAKLLHAKGPFGDNVVIKNSARNMNHLTVQPLTCKPGCHFAFKHPRGFEIGDRKAKRTKSE